MRRLHPAPVRCVALALTTLASLAPSPAPAAPATRCDTAQRTFTIEQPPIAVPLVLTAGGRRTFARLDLPAILDRVEVRSDGSVALPATAPVPATLSGPFGTWAVEASLGAAAPAAIGSGRLALERSLHLVPLASATDGEAAGGVALELSLDLDLRPLSSSHPSALLHAAEVTGMVVSSGPLLGATLALRSAIATPEAPLLLAQPSARLELSARGPAIWLPPGVTPDALAGEQAPRVAVTIDRGAAGAGTTRTWLLGSEGDGLWRSGTDAAATGAIRVEWRGSPEGWRGELLGLGDLSSRPSPQGMVRGPAVNGVSAGGARVTVTIGDPTSVVIAQAAADLPASP